MALPVVAHSPPCEGEEEHVLVQNIKTLLELGVLFGLKITNTKAQTLTDQTLQHWKTEISQMPMPTWQGQNIGRTTKYMKYKLAAYASAHLPTITLEVPECPFGTNKHPHIIIGGTFLSFTKDLLQHKTWSYEWIQSILQIKAAMVEPSIYTVQSGVEETFTKLTTKKEVQVDKSLTQQRIFDDDYIDVTKLRLQHELRRTVWEIFNGHVYSTEDRMRLFIPSKKSHSESSRKKNGALGLIMKDILEETKEGLLVKTSTLLKFHGESKEEERESQEAGVIGSVDVSAVQKQYWSFTGRLMEKALAEQPIAIPVGLAEPLKVRVITKGPARTYFILKSIQKWCHDIMRKLPAFELMGHDVNEDVITSNHEVLRDDEFFFSGDYSDATNKVRAWASETVIEELGRIIKLSENEMALARKSMTKHTLCMRSAKPKYKNGKLEGIKYSKEIDIEKEQEEGQLMGSILSFIVLCIENAALMRYAKESASQEGETLSLTDAKIKLNGDDCSGNFTLRALAMWEKAGTFMGLEPSLGKVYKSREFLTLNSRMYRVCQRHRLPQATYERVKFKEVAFINMGLLKNLEKSKELINTDSEGKSEVVERMGGRESMGQSNFWLMWLCPKRLRYNVQEAYIQYHRKKIEHLDIPWYMPEWAGGLGLCKVFLTNNGEPIVVNAMEPMRDQSSLPSDVMDEQDEDDMEHEEAIAQFRKNTFQKDRRVLAYMMFNWKRFHAKSYGQTPIQKIYDRAMCSFPTKPVEVVDPVGPTPHNIFSQLTPYMIWDRLFCDPMVQNMLLETTASGRASHNERFIFPRKRGREDKEFRVFDRKTNVELDFEVEDEMEKHLLDLEASERNGVAFKHNRGLWSKLSSLPKLPKPVPWEKVQRRRTETVYVGRMINTFKNHWETILSVKRI